LVDCVYTDGHNSCDGGSAFDALYYIKKNGISTQYEYEYTGIMSKCKRTDKKPKPKPIANISSYNLVKPISDQSMQIALHKQPISIALEVNEDFFLYSSGVYTGKCGRNINHAALLIGYGMDKESGLEYYILKNSWGPTWGENGYMKIAKGINQLTNKPYNDGAGQCGILLYGTYPIL
jgi:KDEL-tailed cysteine endopeptidase